MPYVDGFVVPVPRKNVEAYKRIAKLKPAWANSKPKKE